MPDNALFESCGDCRPVLRATEARPGCSAPVDALHALQHFVADRDIRPGTNIHLWHKEMVHIARRPDIVTANEDLADRCTPEIDRTQPLVRRDLKTVLSFSGFTRDVNTCLCMLRSSRRRILL